MPVLFLRIFETNCCAGTHSGGQVRYGSDTQRIYAVLGAFLGTRTNIPSVTRVICNIVCQRDDKRKKPEKSSFSWCRWWEPANRPAVALSVFQTVIKLCTLHYNKNRNTPRFPRSITVLVSADGGT